MGMTGATLSERQAAKELGLRLDQLRHEVNAGRLMGIGPRRHRRFAHYELTRWWALYRSRPWIKPAP